MTWFLDKEFLEKLDLRAYDATAIAKRLDLPVDVVARFVDPARRYTVQTNEDYCLEEELEIGDELLNVLAEDLSFEHTGNAEVRAFKHEELWHYALVPFPWHLHAIAVGEKDDEEDEDEREDDLMSVRSWIEDGNFVLQCGNNYFMGANVESS